MLHNCDAGEYSVITVYPHDYRTLKIVDGVPDDAFAIGPLSALTYYGFRVDDIRSPVS